MEDKEMTKEILLTQDKVALVDDEDFEELNKYKWFALKDRSNYCAGRNINNDGKRRTIRMHTMILNPPVDMQCDHINGNGLDNRRCNLRVVTLRENMQNKQTKKTSKYPGVCWTTKIKRWRAQIYHEGKHYHLGTFLTEEEAYERYTQACYEML